jgi:hypothetical protein
MNSWRITKYNPIYRDINGRYLKNEWTSISDIGKSYEGKLFTVEDYIRTEKLYTDAIVGFMRELQISVLQVSELEKNSAGIVSKQHEGQYSKEVIEIFHSVKDQQLLTVKEVEQISKLILREQLWCKLSCGRSFFVHFGYDYYMYIGSERACEDVIKTIKRSGLFVEQLESPYI